MCQSLARRPAVLLALLGAAFVSVAALGQPAGKPKTPTTVEQCMEAIEGHMDSLDNQLGKPEALKTVWEIERLALQAKSMTPEHLKGGATPESLAGYRKAQIELMKLLLQLEAHVLDKRADEARKTITAIEALEKDSHRKFRARRDPK